MYNKDFFNIFNGYVDSFFVEIILFVFVEVVEYCVEEIVYEFIFFVVDGEEEWMEENGESDYNELEISLLDKSDVRLLEFLEDE